MKVIDLSKEQEPYVVILPTPPALYEDDKTAPLCEWVECPVGEKGQGIPCTDRCPAFTIPDTLQFTREDAIDWWDSAELPFKE